MIKLSPAAESWLLLVLALLAVICLTTVAVLTAPPPNV
jgi:hypothetical protein